ncbi:MAG: sulfotransferase family 2 domain-containing protein [Ardenticatenaceae bacterium]|nr:sulfotransferase family 2 domain-containing protein [Anaerolineales bacterium]MCB8920761.1 sulfotransferase family 2 domain-containing protein [Ardenticatenaceae bacterium]MCB8989720.1 sulfotransferase family 2 domain-containing protein [Ardenticatenaceae bacterium]MCB9002821.1 sulfotransferase family 2 domain-containing protein [Ardenticatenaceae bacterium]
MTDQNERPTLIFLHILKTAGTTLNIILENYYAQDRTVATYPNRQHPDGSIEGFHALSTAEKANIDLLTGHMGFGLHKYLPRPAVYITILRDPVERVISRYYHEYRDPHSLLHPAIRDGMDLKEYVKYYAKVADMDNLQTRMIAGNWEKRGFGPCTKEMLATAKQNLQDYFVVVGLTERFDETYLLLKKTLGWKTTLYQKYNVTPNRPKKRNISEETLQVIREYNRYDIELYHFASKLFDTQIQQQGWRFASEAKLFQLYKILYPTYWRLRSFSVRTYLRNRMKN